MLIANSHLCDVLSVIYPEYEWLPWRFSYVPKGFWSDLKNQRKYLDWVATQLSMTNNNENREGWYKIQQTVIFQLEKNS